MGRIQEGKQKTDSGKKVTSLSVLQFSGLMLLLSFVIVEFFYVSSYAKQQKQAAERANAAVFAALYTTTFDGKPFSYEQEIRTHQLTVVNVWGTWCVNCIAEMPELGDLGRKLAGSEVLLAGYCEDTMEAGKLDEAKIIVQNCKADFPMLQANAESREDILSLTGGLPTTFFIDANGRILNTIAGKRSLEEYEQLIEESLERIEAEQ